MPAAWRISPARVSSSRFHVKSLPAHAVRSLIIARKKLVGQRVTLENQIRGLAVIFGVRLPRALSPVFVKQALRASEGIAGLSAAMQGRGPDAPPCSAPSWQLTRTSGGWSGHPRIAADEHSRCRRTYRSRLHGGY